MAEAFAWGVLAAASLVLGAALALRVRIAPRTIGLVMGFGAGVVTTLGFAFAFLIGQLA